MDEKKCNTVQGITIIYCFKICKTMDTKLFNTCHSIMSGKVKGINCVAVCFVIYG